MAAYLLVDTLLENPVLYEEYKLKAKPVIEKHGGQYLARGGNLTILEADLWKPQRLVLIQFPDVATATGCMNSEEYRQILPISKQSAKRTMIVLEGL